MSVKLTDAQLVMMSAAAQRKDRCLSAPTTIRGAALIKVSAKLTKLGFAREVEAKPGAPTYRLQSDAFGGLDKSIRRILHSGKEDGVGAPFDRRAPQTREGVSMKAGALLVREWNGELERVRILEEGFAWNGQTFGSLSQIAKAMTGTTWNGHRFFGLRQGKTYAADVGADSRRSRNRTAACKANGASRGAPP